jgi:hypothetical protein
MSLIITHNYGFFSCCSVKLSEIVRFFNTNNKLPDVVDSSGEYGWYKINKGDITFDYFEHYNNINIDIQYKINIDYYHSHQYRDYSTLDYTNIIPFVRKYFSPSSEIKEITTNIEKKYNVDYDNTCVLFFRGNDKITETKLCEYNEYIEQIQIILVKDPNVKFLIQSDETEFIEKMKSTFPDTSFYFKDETRHMNKCRDTVDKRMKDKNYVFSKYYLAITIIMSKCKYIICGSGNCSIWIMFYREHSKNVFQNLQGKWITPTF